MSQHDQIENYAKKVISQLLRGESLQIEEIYQIQKTNGLIDLICKDVMKLPPSEILKCLYEMDAMSVSIIENHDSKSIAYGGFYNSKEIIGLFVELLFTQEFEIGNKACDLLTTPGHFPDSLIRDYNEKILKAAQLYPRTQKIVKLLGVTGTNKARELILSKVVDDSREIVNAALGKLGDIKAQKLLVEEYKNAKSGRQKEEYAILLGYVNSVKTVLTLAMDFRNEQTYIWREPSALRSVRVDIIKGLHVAFPEEPVFWKPTFKPSDDSYYEAIEEWLMKNLDVKWSTARPPFLYELDAPF